MKKRSLVKTLLAIMLSIFVLATAIAPIYFTQAGFHWESFVIDHVTIEQLQFGLLDSPLPIYASVFFVPAAMLLPFLLLDARSSILHTVLLLITLLITLAACTNKLLMVNDGFELHGSSTFIIIQLFCLGCMLLGVLIRNKYLIACFAIAYPLLDMVAITVPLVEFGVEFILEFYPDFLYPISTCARNLFFFIGIACVAGKCTTHSLFRMPDFSGKSAGTGLASLKNPKKQLLMLKELYDCGAITEQEYNQKRAQVLSKF